MALIKPQVLESISEAVTECITQSMLDLKKIKESKTVGPGFGSENAKEILLHLFDARFETYKSTQTNWEK